MREDIERWNRKYLSAELRLEKPDWLLTEYRSLLDGEGRAIDVACGMGHNAIFVAEQGYEVVAVDGSIVALDNLRCALHGRDLPIELVAVDLDDFTLPPSSFDLILVVRFLNRELIPRLKSSLRPGGLFMYRTFNRNLLRDRPAFNPEFLLEPGELAGSFDDFETLATNDSHAIEESLSYWVGRRSR